MRNVRVRISYDGSRFFGWQRQDGFESVQGALEEALLSLLGQAVTVHGAGRTDTGVHALGQVASFHVDTELTDERLRLALNAHLADGVVLRDLETCAEDFHALRSATGKRYAYIVGTSRHRPAFGGAYHHWTRESLALGPMREAAQCFVGRHDFSAFANAGSPRSSNVRHVRSLKLLARRRFFVLVIEGEGFLYNMVRTIAGTLLEVGRGKLEASDIPRILASGVRKEAGPTAPANGLYLVRVLYAERPFVRAGERPPPGVFPDVRGG